MDSFFEVWAKESPETSKAFSEFAGAIGKYGGLDPKTHQLVYIGMQVCKGNVSSVCAHTGFAKALGATRQEIIGVIATSMMEVGINGVAECLVPALEAYDAAPGPEPAE
jgi:alkylhydroperoxidase/carboxymuconolactone decarboxylase family protein YurZ